MNCRQFTSHIVEAARGQLMDAATRDAATRHAETCAACAARLSQERNLTNALRTVAANMNGLSAPARVEANLLAAFQESRANSEAAKTGATSSRIALAESFEAAARVPSQRRPWRNAFAATAIAASLALVALVTLYQQFTQTSPHAGAQTNVVAQGGTEPSPIAPAVITSTPPPTAVAAPAVEPQRDRSQTARREDSARPTARRDDSERASLTSARTATPKMIASRQVIDGGSAIFAAGEGESAANPAGLSAAKPNEAETVTEFIPLVAGAPAAAPLESGQLVRVQLPRAALASLGLPLNAERGNETVKADVLLGSDGLAHAIRFVR
jgi:negative regulator of sigma E activity